MEQNWKEIKHKISQHACLYLKTKIKQFNGVGNTNFWADKVSKEGLHDTCTACISIDSVLITYWWK